MLVVHYLTAEDLKRFLYQGVFQGDSASCFRCRIGLAVTTVYRSISRRNPAAAVTVASDASLASIITAPVAAETRFGVAGGAKVIRRERRWLVGNFRLRRCGQWSRGRGCIPA